MRNGLLQEISFALLSGTPVRGWHDRLAGVCVVLESKFYTGCGICHIIVFGPVFHTNGVRRPLCVRDTFERGVRHVCVSYCTFFLPKQSDVRRDSVTNR